MMARFLLAPALLVAGGAALLMPPSPAHQSQLVAFEKLFPSSELSMRNAASRKDGYWPFVGRKEEPPLELTYGEFPLPFFSKVMEKARAHAALGAGDGVFCDLGSGAGRLVIWAAAIDTWSEVRGVECLPSLHTAACTKLNEANALPELDLLTPSECIQLREGSWNDPDLFDWGQVDVAFAYSTAFPVNTDGVLAELSAALTPRLREGCIVCTTDYKLDAVGFKLLEEIVDANEGVGGDSVAYIYRKETPGLSADEVMDAKLEEQRERVGELEAQLAAREAEFDKLAKRAAALEVENHELRKERDALRSQLDDVEGEMLSALQDWAQESNYVIASGQEASGRLGFEDEIMTNIAEREDPDYEV